MNHDEREQLRQSLLELHYDLLDESEAETLREVIRRDPEVAAEWEKMQRLAEQFTDAAKLQPLDIPAVDWRAAGTGSFESAPNQIGTETPEGGVARTAIEAGEQVETPAQAVEPVPARPKRSWPFATALAAVAAMLGTFVIGAWYWERIPPVPAAVIGLRAQQVPEHLAGSDHEFRVVTSKIDQPASVGRFPVTPATLSFAVFSRGNVLFSGTARTDQDGTGRIALPPDLVIPPESTLKVTAQPLQDSLAASTIDLPLEPTRCVTHLIVDRPVYRAGETVYFRSLTLRRRSLRPVSGFPIRFELRGPDGERFGDATLEGVTEKGVGNGAFTIPADVQPGTYTLQVESLDGMFPDQSCSFQVRVYRAPTFRSTVQFGQRSYAPGETVEAEIAVSRIASDEPLEAAAVQIAVDVDQQRVHQARLQTSRQGTCTARFTLPEAVVEGEGTMQIEIEADGTVETRLVPLPIQTGEVTVRFYPEGGELVEGLENRVYFTAHDALGQPVHLEGSIVDQAGQLVVPVTTVLDGMGRFRFTPLAGETYRLSGSPAGSSQPRSYPLPDTVNDLPVIDTGSGVFDAETPIELVLRASRSQVLLLRAACRGQVVAEQKVEVSAGDNRLQLSLGPDQGGVVRLTVLDPDSTPATPLVERLVYRRPSQRLEVEVVDEASAPYAPGESVQLELQVRDETGTPTVAILGVSVVDEAAWSLDQQDRPSMATQFLLLSEIERPEDLEHADFYLKPEPEAEQALDLLLGTQGWRRFVDWKPEESLTEFREQLIRLLELDGAETGREQSFDNARPYASQWLRFRQTLDVARRRAWLELRILAVLVIGIWLATLVIHRRWARASLASAWLLVASSLVINGCGARSDTMVVQSAAPDTAAEEAARDVEAPEVAPLADAPVRAAVAAEPPLSIDSAIENAAETQAMEASPEWVDWLDADKVAWLLRISKLRRNPTTSGGNEQDVPPARESIGREELRELMVGRGVDAGAAADELIQRLRFPVRQYAHRRPDAASGGSGDYSETIFWHPLLITDDAGRATLRFDLPDSITTFRLQVDGHTVTGRLGAGTFSMVTTEGN